MSRSSLSYAMHKTNGTVSPALETVMRKLAIWFPIVTATLIAWSLYSHWTQRKKTMNPDSEGDETTMNPELRKALEAERSAHEQGVINTQYQIDLYTTRRDQIELMIDHLRKKFHDLKTEISLINEQLLSKGATNGQ